MDDQPRMTIADLRAETAIEPEQGFWDRHRFFLLILVTIFISLLLVSISLVAYNVSGTAQLDLSRPGYQSVSDQVQRDDAIDSYSAFGAVTLKTIDEFTKLYDEQSAKAKAVDAFNGDPLNPEVLEFTNPAVRQ